jgi:hypothetical protein
MTLSEEFSHSRFDQIEAAIDAGDACVVERLSNLARSEYLPVHDGLRDVVGATLDFASRATSPEEGEAIGRRVIAKILGATGDAPQYEQADLADRVRSIAAGWFWHATQFQVSEDDDKITFRLDPCGSGGRLELEGRYDGPDAWTRSTRPSASTFMLTGFPMYSNHCAEMTRAGLAAGNATFVVEGWHDRGCGACVQHTYKRVEAVPPETYRRVGLESTAVRSGENADVGRLFSAKELADLGTHPLERTAAVVAAGDLATARAALTESRDAWAISMHGAYRRWISLLWAEVIETLGRKSMERLVAATAPEFVRHRRGGSAYDWAAFWSMHFALRSIREADGGIELTLDPSMLLEPGGSAVTAEALVKGLQLGFEARGWSDAGVFLCVDGTITHAVGP